MLARRTNSETALLASSIPRVLGDELIAVCRDFQRAMRLVELDRERLLHRVELRIVELIGRLE